jgi:hypothetical protein
MYNPATPSDFDGAWIGIANAGGVTLRIVFHITNTQAGLTATMDSPDQGITGIPVTVVTRHGSSLTLELHQLGGAFQGTISPDWTTIGGTWTQGGASQPFTLKRVKDAAELELRRPQNPAKHYPYREDEVTFENKAPGIRLVGTLTVPEAAMKVPGVVLIAGSGPHGRNELVAGHRPFLVLADYLTRKGSAVLR